jgi:predicted metal-binding membrane protein
MARDEDQPVPLPLQRSVVLVLLLALAVAAWAVIVWDDLTSMDSTSPATGLRVALFLAMWVVMMVAMMLPSTAPMILAFHRMQAGKRELHDTFISTWAFVVAYLLVWCGFAVYAGALASGVGGVRTAASKAEVGGVILMLAGLYQLSPFKEVCLAHCRTPIDFTGSSSGNGVPDAFRMGLLHGVYCLGCYWMLFVVLFPLGMSIVAMVAVTLVVLAEKTLPSPRIVTYATAVVLVLYGALMSVTPQLFPTAGKDSSATMPAEMPMKMQGTGSAPAVR